MEEIKLFEMFSGFGGASFALKKAGIQFECVGISEIDKYAIQCYNQNFSNIKNYGDCTKINPDDLPDFNLLTGGFPCQDVSIAGNRDLSKGRTNLFQEIIRIAEVKKPKYMLLENVKGLLSINNGKYFQYILFQLNRIGYHVIWKVLNTKDYGIPQNRERIWFVCKLGSWKFMEFIFPSEEKLIIKLKDILEKNINKKYYLSKEQMKKIILKKEKMKKKGYGFGLDITKQQDISPTICSRDYKDGGSIRIIGKLDIKGQDAIKRIYDEEGIAPSISTCQGGDRVPKVCKIINNKQKSAFKTEDIAFTLTGSGRNSGQNQGVIFREQTRDVNKAVKIAKELSNKTDKPVQLDLYHLQSGEIRPLSTYIPQDLDNHRCIQAGKPKEILIYKNIIRRLTPKECFRLMGFLDDKINLDKLSDGQLYKLAGNGWDINLVSKIFKKMLK